MFMNGFHETYLAHFEPVEEESSLPGSVTEYCTDRAFVLGIEAEMAAQLGAIAYAGANPSVPVADAHAMFLDRNPQTILLAIPKYQFEAGVARAQDEIPEWFTAPLVLPPTVQERLEELVHNFSLLSEEEQVALRVEFEADKAELEGLLVAQEELAAVAFATLGDD
jgi:hypothetical protein